MKTLKFSKSNSFGSGLFQNTVEELHRIVKWSLKSFVMIIGLVRRSLSGSARTHDKISATVLAHLKRKTSIHSVEVKNRCLADCISGVVYKVNIKAKIGSVKLSSSTKVYVENNGKIVNISRPASSIDCREFVKILNPSFRLRSISAGNKMLAVLSTVYGVENRLKTTCESSVEMEGNIWCFKIETAVNHLSCFFMKTNESGKIVKIIYKI